MITRDPAISAGLRGSDSCFTRRKNFDKHKDIYHMRNLEAENYAKELIQALQETQKHFDGEGLMPPVFDHWIKSIRVRCKEKYRSYEIGEVDDYKLSQDDLTELYESAVSQFVDEGITSMVDRGLLEVAVAEDGEFEYGLSEKGKEYAKLLGKLKDDDDE